MLSTVNPLIKIGLFGNMNNGMFSLTRYLLDKGFDCTLYLMNEQDHFFPSADTYDEAYRAYTYELDWLKKGHWKTTKEEIRNITEKHDFLIGTDMTPAFFHKAGVKLDLMVPHGGDIFFKPYFYWKPYLKNLRILTNIKPFIGHYYEKHCQRMGLRNADVICIPYVDTPFEVHFSRLGLIHNRFFSNYPFYYYPTYQSAQYQQFRDASPYYRKIKKLKRV